MSISVLEQELARKLQVFRAEISSHDRAVVVGFFLALFPLPPVSLLGLIICIFNYWLFRSGKLDLSERKLIVLGVIIGLFTSIIGALFFYYIAVQVGEFNWEHVREAIGGALNELWRHPPFRWILRENVVI